MSTKLKCCSESSNVTSRYSCGVKHGGCRDKRVNAIHLAMMAHLAVMAPNALAYEFNWGSVSGQLDSTLSIGSQWRLQDPASDLTAVVNGGSKNSANYDDGNLNFDKGDAIATVFKGSHDLELSYQHYGAFIRGRYWYDSVLKDDKMSHREIPDAAVDESGSGANVLDAFVYGDFFVGNRPLSVRIGRQVISWGESLFIQGGINVINPFDVTAFRAPGAEIKEGFLPTDKIYANFAFTDEVSIEAYVDTDWRRTEIDACGTFWGPADFAGRGCNYAVATTGEHLIDGPGQFEDVLRAYQQANIRLGLAESEAAIAEATAGVASAGLAAAGAIAGEVGLALAPSYLRVVHRLEDDLPDDDKLQFGAAIRWFSPELNNTEFGFYYIKYHSKLPFIRPELVTTTLIPFGTVPTGNITTTSAGYSDPYSDTPDQPFSQQTLIAPASQGYNFAYPEDIDLFGVSFSTSVESGFFKGLAIAGEWSYRPNAPLQQSLAAFLNRGLYTEAASTPTDITNCPDVICNPFLNSENVLETWSEMPMHQIQVNFIYSWADIWGASQMVLASEVGFIYLPDLEKYDRNPIFDLDNTANRDEVMAGSAAPNLLLDTDRVPLDVTGQSELFVSKTSWGIRNRLVLFYNNVFAGFNLMPVISFNYDVDGYAPGPGAVFIEGSAALGLSVTATYLEKYSVNLGVTKFFGTDTTLEGIDQGSDDGGIIDTRVEQTINRFHDRDFASLSLKVSF